MALSIEFEGFVKEVKQLSWGSVAVVTHNQRAKNEQSGEWETVSKDYIDVTLPDGASVNENDLVKVKGTFKVTTYDKKDGTTGIAIKVRAQDISPVERRGVTTTAPATSLTNDELPF